MSPVPFCGTYCALLSTLERDADEVYSVAVSPDGSAIVSGCLGEAVRLWRATDGALLRTLEGHTSDANSVAVSPGGATIVSGSYDKTVRL